MASVTQISLESLLLRATNPINPTLDNVALNAFYALINKERDGAPLGVKVIAARLPVANEKEVLSTLQVLDSCMSKCGSAFQNEVGKFRFLNEMIKLVSPKYLGSRTPLAVKQRVLQLLYLWTLDYPKEMKIKEAFEMLRKQGVIKEIPNPNIPQEALGNEVKKKPTNSIFQDEEKSNILRKLLQSKDPEDIQAANWLIKSMVKEDEKLADLKSKTLIELEPVQNNIKLLTEMIGSYREGDTTKNELDIMNELHGNLERFKPTLKSMVSTDESWPMDLLENVLKTMDNITECLTKYSEIVLGKGKSNLHSLLELDQLAVGAGSSLIQVAGFREAKGSVDDCSCSSHNGSSQISHISSTTSKSSIDVLCDVFSNIESSEDSEILQPVSAIKPEPQNDKDSDKCKKNALEDLDVLGEHLMKENLPTSNYRNQEKIPMNLLTKINEIKKCQMEPKIDVNCLLNDSDNGELTHDEADDCLVDITEDKTKTTETTSENPVRLKDISIRLEDIKPSSQKSIVALDDKNGLTIMLHKAQKDTCPFVTVYVVTTTSKNEMALSGFLFQAVVPKGCKHRLLAPSSTDLPPHNPFLPPSAITQIMLVSGESQEDISLKFIVSYVIDDETVTEMGEVNVPLDSY